MSVPQVPPRPARSQHQQPPMASMDIPKIPPRPGRRASERSQSPNQGNYPRSPFNEPPLGISQSNKSGGLYNSNSQNNSSVSLGQPPRPPSVTLPSVGQEGSEYAEIDCAQADTATTQESGQNEPQETRNVAGDLPLHAPKPSLSKDSAKKRVAGVTRTDSGQAAAAGFGKTSDATTPADDQHPQDRILKAKVSFRTASSTSTERPTSAQAEDEHGIPEIGQRVPMYPDAGDVQAPSHSPFQQQFPAGIGYHNAGMTKPSRHHRRTPSGREILPPGSYGMHGHGMQSADQFEKDWYAKHPDALEREEHGEYGPGIGGGRGEWALSSDDLNKLVRETAKKAQADACLPNEQIGYQASEEYASRLSAPHSGTFRTVHSNNSQPHVESPLRKASFPVDPDATPAVLKTRSSDPSGRSTEHALESETEDDDVYVPPPTVRKSKIHGNGYDPPTENLGPTGGNTDEKGGYIEETGYGVPILASDEVARTPGAEFMQPAVSPAQSRRGSTYYTGTDQDHYSLLKSGSRSGSASNSRPSSRPASVHGLSLSRFPTHDEDREAIHTPLEDVEEYEPLFPDEEGNKQSKPATAAERLKLREQMKRFPSQDIWEDTPNSLQLQATVDTPEPTAVQADVSSKAPAAAFETPEQEAARKGEVTEEEKAKLIPQEERLAKSNFKLHLREELHRPGMKQRFPSRDIWEDSPDSAELTTTVGEAPANDLRSPTDAGLEAGAVVQTSARPKDGIMSGEQARDGATAGVSVMGKPSIPPRPNKSKATPPPADLNAQPPVPARPPKRLHQIPPADAKVPLAPSKLASAASPTEGKDSSPTEARKGPYVPDRTKPQFPARPEKPAAQEPGEMTSLSKVTSATSIGSEGSDTGLIAPPPPGAPKPKPAVPARPAGNKIAALQGGFLADLNSRLKLGPQAPKVQEKEPEPEEEKAPLADARKGRAKGPVKRKHVGPVTEAATEGKAAAPKWSICQPFTVWQTDGKGAVALASPAPAPPAPQPYTTEPSSAEPTTETSPPGEAAPDAREMQQAKLAVEESIQATDRLKQGNFTTPESAADLPTPQIETERNPLSIAPNTPDLESPVKRQTPINSNPQSQSGVNSIPVNPGTEPEQNMIAPLDGNVASSPKKSDGALIKE
ncbi:MAG: hypothetical protein Q9217_004122 [Psora testacea]